MDLQLLAFIVVVGLILSYLFPTHRLMATIVCFGVFWLAIVVKQWFDGD